MVSFLVLCCMLLSNHIESMHDHVRNTHCLPLAKCQPVENVVNKSNGVLSGIIYEKKGSAVVPVRKTFFDKDMSQRSDFTQRLDNIAKSPTAFVNQQPSEKDGRRVEYKEDLSGKFMVAVVKNKSQDISTIYPILRYFSLQELAGKSDSDQIYVASKYDNIAKKYIDMTLSAGDIKKASRVGTFLALSPQTYDKPRYLMDISQYCPSLFHDTIIERGSIAVEADWIKSKK